MYNPIEEKKKYVQGQIEKSFDNGIDVNNDIEKAKWKVGDERQYQGVTYFVSGFNAKGTPQWRKKKDGGANTNVSKPQTNQQSSSSNSNKSDKTWDKLDGFHKKGTDENKLWESWYKYQKSGDPSHMSDFRNILENKFPHVHEWSQTSPNSGKSIITARDADGNSIAKIDLSGNKVVLSDLQTFMDKIHASNHAKNNNTTTTTKNSSKSADKKKDNSPTAKIIKKVEDRISKLKYSDNYTPERIQKLTEAIKGKEDIAKQILAVKFPAAGSVGQWSTYSQNHNKFDLGDGRKLVASTYKEYNTTSRYAGHLGTTRIQYELKVEDYGKKRTLSWQSASRFSTGHSYHVTTSAEAKNECIVEGLFRYFKV